MYECMYMNVCTYVYLYVYVYFNEWSSNRVCMYVRVGMYVYMYEHAYMYSICFQVYVYLFKYVYVIECQCTYKYLINVCMYLEGYQSSYGCPKLSGGLFSGLRFSLFLAFCFGIREARMSSRVFLRMVHCKFRTHRCPHHRKQNKQNRIDR